MCLHLFGGGGRLARPSESNSEAAPRRMRSDLMAHWDTLQLKDLKMKVAYSSYVDLNKTKRKTTSLEVRIFTHQVDILAPELKWAPGTSDSKVGFGKRAIWDCL